MILSYLNSPLATGNTAAFRILERVGDELP